MTYYKRSLADRLDVLVRSCNRNQTIGIPIGPETSRIIAEVISSRIDNQFRTLQPLLPVTSVDRLQDDWFVGLRTLEESEEILSNISSAYRTFGLEINGCKTSISHILAAPAEAWVSEINAFLSHRVGPISGNRLTELFALSRLQSLYPHEPVINYALSVVGGYRIAPNDIKDAESFLLKAAVVSPVSMDRICRIILNIQHSTKMISVERVRRRFTDLAVRNLRNGNPYEVIWLIYTIRGLKKPLRSADLAAMA